VGVLVPTRCACVAVLSAWPGVGGTTVAALLAAALGGGRDVTVAVDAHPGPGSLSGTLGPGPEVFADDLPDLLEHPALTWPELRAALGWPGSGPAVLAGRPEDGPAGHAGDRPGRPGRCRSAGPLDEPGWLRVLHGLARHATVVVVDCGPDLAAPAARAAVAAADQLVLVTGAQVPGPLPGLAARPARPGQPVTVVVSRPAAGLDAGQALDQTPWARGAFLLPDDPAGPAALGPGPFAWEQVPARWRRQAYELAFQLVSDWPALGLAALAQPAPSA
jgi:hypothetical protein